MRLYDDCCCFRFLLVVQYRNGGCCFGWCGLVVFYVLPVTGAAVASARNDVTNWSLSSQVSMPLEKDGYRNLRVPRNTKKKQQLACRTAVCHRTDLSLYFS